MYDEAIEQAGRHGYIQYEALANELAGLFWTCREKPHIGLPYLRRARICYESWGAQTKALSLEKRFPETARRVFQGATTVTVTTTETSMAHTLDLASVLKSTEAIVGEIELDRLLTRLLDILAENAGAERGFLILRNREEFLVEAEYGSGKSTRRSSILREGLELADAIVRYVARTKSRVVLENASADDKFDSDPHIRERRVKSLLCLPLVRQGNLTGILYLENNLSTGVFAHDRLDLLNLISGQATHQIVGASDRRTPCRAACCPTCQPASSPTSFWSFSATKISCKSVAANRFQGRSP